MLVILSTLAIYHIRSKPISLHPSDFLPILRLTFHHQRSSSWIAMPAEKLLPFGPHGQHHREAVLCARLQIAFAVSLGRLLCVF